VPDASPLSGLDYSNDIEPLIIDVGCLACHGPAKLGGLDLTSEAKMRLGGESGKPASVACDPENSPLYTKTLESFPFGSRMPLTGSPLEAAESERIAQWIREGAGQTFDPETCRNLDFDKDIIPILNFNGCLGCHGGAGLGGLDLTTAANVAKGGQSTLPASVPPSSSRGAPTHKNEAVPTCSIATDMPKSSPVPVSFPLIFCC
jgi:hypothetical protein